jgi:hypothetical protein
MAVHRFAIMFLTAHSHSGGNISVGNECVWENNNGVECDVSPAIHKQ